MASALSVKAKGGTIRSVSNSYRGHGLPRRRNELKPADGDFPARFALHLRELMAVRGWSSKDVSAMLVKAGVDVGPRGIDVWLRGEGGPKFRDLERIGSALGLDDYRELLPAPAKRRR